MCVYVYVCVLYVCMYACYTCPIYRGVDVCMYVCIYIMTKEFLLEDHNLLEDYNDVFKT